MKTWRILKGWFRFMFAKRSHMADKRLAICWECPYRRWHFCGKCGCELHAKAEIEEEKCPLNFW